MPLDLDPIFHTVTMVNILREQGSPLYAMELAKIILEKDPENDSVRAILDELKKEGRSAFERFKSAGKSDRAPKDVSGGGEGIAVSEDLPVSEENKTELLPLKQVSEASSGAGLGKKVSLLEGLLSRVQRKRKNYGAG